MASKVRHSRWLESQHWLWRRVEPAWERAFSLLMRRRGFPTHVNGDAMRLTYRYAARYDRDRVYEPAVHRAIAESVAPGMTVLDVGAHVGLLTISIAQRVAPHGLVIAFEPAPVAYRLLRRHVRLNGLEDRVEAVPVVVSDEATETSLFVHEDSMSASVCRRNVEELAPQDIDHADEVRVPAVTTDALCAERNLHPDLIKIDVEGAEGSVLRGAQRVLREDRPLLLCEVHPDQLAAAGDSVEALERLTETSGYTVTLVDAPNELGIYHVRMTPAERTRSVSA